MSEEKNSADEKSVSFDDLNLAPDVAKGVAAVGYETPSPIQAQAIPVLLGGHDMVAQAQTGTGKTAAFALPMLSMLERGQSKPQALVLAPTRELAIQVAEAFQTYAHHMNGFHVLPVYGGSSIVGQLKQLKRGAHIVVGTPGRVMDLIRRKALDLSGLKQFVLDEADEMLRMGFLEDVEWILSQAPDERQIGLFSATMPQQIRRIAETYLRDPVTVTIKERTATATSINQRYWMVSGLHKLDALTRILEGEDFDGIIVFVRTKRSCEELAEKLAARGFASAPLNGDVAQAQRERTVEALKNGKLDILVATDVAARGLDVDRISHVINYDIPYDTEAYVHRVGRTGRAGREGEAILFVAPRERRMLRSIERATGQKISLMELPSTEDINDTRVAKFKSRIADVLATEDLGFYTQIIESFRQEHNVPAMEIASALAKLVQGDEPLLLKERQAPKARNERDDRGNRDDRGPKGAPGATGDLVTYRIEVGYRNGVRPGNIVGAICNEANLTPKEIGRIDIQDDFSLVDLPMEFTDDAWSALQNAWVSGQKLNITYVGDDGWANIEQRPSRFRDNNSGGGGRGGSGERDPGFKNKHKKKFGKKKPNAKFQHKKKGHRKGPSKPKA